jgi:hypothetical protein
MKFKQIKIEKDLETYRHAIATHIDVLLPLEYLKQGKVYGYYNKNGVICGGFAMITSGPFRVLDSIPNFEGLEIDPTLKHTCEITGVWLSSSGRTKYSSLRFWLNIMTKVLTSRKKYFVYAYSTRKTGLQNIYSRANPIVLFRGETKIMPGMPAPDHESIEVVLRRRVLIQALKNPDFFLKRLIPKPRNKKARKPIKEFYETQSNPILPLITTGIDLRARESKINH